MSDLLLAESVHQAVQGNLERTKASLQALTEPEAAPDPEVVRTPRSARLLTFRMTLKLDAAATAKWPGKLTVRAAANPAVNTWLAQHLPAPSAIQWSVKNGVGPTQFSSIADLQLQPIDLVLLTGDQLGQLSSELERLIVRRIRAARKVADNVRTRIAPLSGPVDDVPPLVLDFDASAPGAQSLATLHALLVRLRRLISRGRAMHALDWLPSTEINRVLATDPTGSAPGVADLDNRLNAGIDELTKVSNQLAVARAALAPLELAIDAVMNELFAAHAFGMPEALPAEGEELSDARVTTLRVQAQVGTDPDREAAGGRRDAAYPQPRSPADNRAGEDAGNCAPPQGVARARDRRRARAVRFGLRHRPAVSVPSACPGNGTAAGRQRPPNRHANPSRRMAALGRTRAPGDGRCHVGHGGLRVDGDAHRRSARAATATAARYPWIGGSFTTPLPEGEWLAVVTLNGASSFSGVQCGLVLDEWTESVPADHATTGVAFHFDRPNATAPQALLLAVPPVAHGPWQWNALKGSVREAFELAKLRAVQPEALMTGGYFQGLPAILSEFTKSRFAATHLTERSVRSKQLIFP